MDPATPVDAVQPDTPVPAQGGDDHLTGLYDLSTAPEELRPHLEAELRKINEGVSQRFRDHADYRKQWEPLEKIDGLRDVPSEELTELLQFREVASDPVQLEDWWVRLGTEMGWFEGDDGAAADDGAGQAEDVPAWAQQLVDRLDGLENSVKPLHEHVTTQEQQRAQAEADRKIREDLDTLKTKHGDFSEDAVLKLAFAYQGETDAIQRGFEDYLQITGQAQGDLIDRKADQPSPTLNGGRPDTTPEKITTFGPEMRAAARARFG